MEREPIVDLQQRIQNLMDENGVCSLKAVSRNLGSAGRGGGVGGNSQARTERRTFLIASMWSFSF